MKKKINFILCNFLVQTLQLFQKKIQFFFFADKKLKKPPSKVAQKKTQIHFFFLTASSAQMAQTEEFMFQNVAYRPTVYRTGASAFKSRINFQIQKIDCEHKFMKKRMLLPKYF